MNENEDFGFEDFESALFDGDYQTDVDTGPDDSNVTETDTDTQEASSETETQPEDGDSSEEEHTSDSEENGAEDNEEADSDTNAGQSFTIKVNKEERTVTLAEMTALAQKGADYDRVKERDQQNQQTIQELNAKLDGMANHQEALDILDLLAERTGSTVDALAKTLYRNFRKSGGASEETAELELENARLKKANDAASAQAAQQQEQKQTNEAEARAQRDMEEFSRDYPDVELTEELVDKLVPDIQNGMSLSAAYRKLEKAQDSTRIAELERQLAAKKHNSKNKRQSPGSQQDSGGRRTRTDYEEFEAALFG